MTITAKPVFEPAIADNPADEAAGKVTSSRYKLGVVIKQAAARLLGRTTADAGETEEISVGSGLVFSALSLALDIATAANIRARASNKALTADNIASAKGAVALAYSATRSLVWTDGWLRTTTLTGNMTISNPSSVEVGDTIVLYLTGNDATQRSVSWGTNYKGSLPEVTVTSTRSLFVTLTAVTSTLIVVGHLVVE